MGRTPSPRLRHARQQFQQSVMPDPGRTVKALPADDVAALRQGDIDLIAALLVTRTVRAAAALSGTSEATARRRAKDPAFQRVLWQAKKRDVAETVGALARRQRRGLLGAGAVGEWWG
jgi:hypothetical protein